MKFKIGDTVEFITADDHWHPLWKKFEGTKGTIVYLDPLDNSKYATIKVRFDKKTPTGGYQYTTSGYYLRLVSSRLSHPLTTIFK